MEGRLVAALDGRMRRKLERKPPSMRLAVSPPQGAAQLRAAAAGLRTPPVLGVEDSRMSAGYDDLAAIEAAMELRATCACGHSKLAHIYDGCAMCADQGRSCGGFREQRTHRLRVAAAMLRGAFTALRR